MRFIMAATGATLLGSIGWVIGAHLNLFFAVVLGAIGGGYGLYYGRKLFDDNMGD
jgi:hypothetical protein